MKHKRKIISNFFCCFLCATLAAQTSKIDSLEHVLASGKLKNPEKAELLNKLSHEYLTFDLEKSKMYAFEALRLAKDTGLKKAEAEANIELANSYTFVDFELHREYAMEALQLAQNYGLKEAEARAYFTLGNYYWNIALPYQSHAHYMKAEKIYLELNDKERLYLINFNLMLMFIAIKDYDNATYFANKVLVMATERKDWIRILITQTTIGETRFRNDKNQEALDYFLDLYHKALHIEDSLGVRSQSSTAIISNCIDIYLNMKRYHEVLPYVHQTRNFFQTNEFLNMLGPVYTTLARVHAALHNIDSAEYYINKAMDSPLIIYNRSHVYLANAKVDSLKGNYLSALANFQKYYHIQDSLSKEEKTTEMARLKVWHEFDQKEHEKMFLQQENQKQRKLTLILAISLVMTFVLFATAVFFYRKTVENNRELRNLHKVKDKLFSVVAHDLRSPMAALVSVLKLADKNKLDTDTQAMLFKEISSRVDNTYSLLDNLLRWSKSQMQGITPAPVYFDVQEEIQALTDTLQSVAAAKSITLENHIEQRQVYADRDMFSVVVRNLTTNAIKYTSAGGKVTLASNLSDNMLVLSVKDTGTGMSKEEQDNLFKLSETKSRRGTANESGTGLGLVMCADFVNANGGNIWFSSVQNEGSTFFFNVPVKNKYSTN